MANCSAGEKKKKQVEHKIWVWSEVLGALHYYQRITHHILWSGAIWGNSQVRSWRLQRDVWYQSEWVMNGSTVFAWIQYRLVFPASKKDLVIPKLLLLSPSFFFSSFGLWRLDHSISKTLCNGWPRNERTPNTRVKCVFGETTVVPHSCMWLYRNVELWVTCRKAALRITGQHFFFVGVLSWTAAL